MSAREERIFQRLISWDAVWQVHITVGEDGTGRAPMRSYDLDRRCKYLLPVASVCSLLSIHPAHLLIFLPAVARTPSLAS